MKSQSIYFCRPRDPYGEFSNFSNHSITDDDGLVYRTGEHFYQSKKTLDINQRERIRQIYNQKEAKIYASSLPLRPDWEDVKVEVMMDTLRKKVNQHPQIKELLLSTGSMILVEFSRKDYFWGCGEDFSGQNMLGKCWMKIREEIQ